MATKTEQELERLQAQLAALEAKKTAEDAAKAADTARVRRLAVALHELLCPLEHSPMACTWKMDSNCDDAGAADWTEKDHVLWLQRARHGIAKMLELGFEVVDPPETP